MSEKNTNQRSFISYDILITLLFVGLKLSDHIDWAWIWVLSPLWIPLALAFIIVVFTNYFL